MVCINILFTFLDLVQVPHSQLQTAFYKSNVSCLFCEPTSENARIAFTSQHLYWALYLFGMLCQLVVAEQLELQVASDNQLTDIPCQFFVEMAKEELLHKTSFHFRGIVSLWCKLCEK